MKIFTKYFILLIPLLLFAGCDKPAPTELTMKDEQLDVELLTKDTNDEFYTSDSSGVVDDLKKFTNVVTVSGIKITKGDQTYNAAFAQAIFFDKNSKVHSPDGRLLGFKTRLLGNVQFNGIDSRLAEYRIRFTNRNNGVHRDTLLGYRHVLNSLFPQQDFNYEFNSSVTFNIDFLPLFGGNSFTFDIPTPSEITGSVRFEGTRRNNTLRAILTWNAMHHQNFEIILGASTSNNEMIFPLFRLRTKDDGELIIPASLINRIPQRFKTIVINIVRKEESHHEINNNDLYVLSQSIHSLVVDIP